MRACLFVWAALALAPGRPPAATADRHPRTLDATDPRLDHIKSQILAKLGLSSRPTPHGAPPRDVVRQILARAADPHTEHAHAHELERDHEQTMREIIAIAHRDKCSIGCKGSPSSPSFLSGQKYNYGVEGTVSVFLTAADKQETSVKILGQVSVTAVGTCVNELRVQNLVISGPDGKKYSSPPGIDKPVRFSLQDGRVGTDICVENGDTRRSLNIKRAIISLLQSEQKSSTEVDIFGACPTEASSSQEGGAVLIHRTRDLSRCAHREQGKNDFLTAVYNPTAEIKGTEVLQSLLNVESKVNAGIPEKVSATEEYLYKPFSVGENGAKAKVHTKLTLTGKAAGANGASHCNVPRTIIFENPKGVPTTQSNLQSALSAVKDTAKTVSSEASSKSAGNFAQLVRILRVTSKDDLLAVYNQVKGNNLEKRVFLDGLLRAGTGPSIEASIAILKTKELSTLEQHLVFISLGNARSVNNDALKAAASLLDLSNLPKEIYLGVGALAGVYCRENNCHNTKNEGITALSQKLAAKLQNCKPKNKVEEDNVVAVLKGIRNIRHLENNLIDKITHCAVDNNVKARVRVAALEAFQADPCSAKLKKTGLDLLKNRQLDSEIRIKAYLAVIACPCGKSANEIKNLLESEPVHQVGRFITTSLRNIRTSVNPDKQLARQHYGLIRTPNKFNVDDRKYSYYEEASYNIDALGIGGNVEETVIYSQDSFLPRSATFNLTTEVFGHNINVLEIGGRQGNLDRVIEHFLGPKSFLRTEEPQSLYDNFLKRYEESKHKVESSLTRKRRNVKSEIENFDKHLKAEAVSYNNELDLDLYLKLFGTDAVFLSLGDDKGLDFNKLIDQALKYVNTGFHKLKRFQQEVRANLLFLDAELAYPTSTGLPLKLDLIGSATGRLEVATNLDIPQIIRNPENAKIDVKLVPSTDIEVACLLLIDADAVATGLKVTSNLHSSTGGHLIFKVLENGRGFDLQLGLPVDKQEIITASDDMVFVTTEKGQKEKSVPLKIDVQKKEYAECFDQLAGILGFTVCGEISIPFAVSGPEAQASLSKFASRYPWTGPTKLKLVLEKNDLRGYHIKGLLRDDKKGKQSFELLFDAEGSKNRRTQFTGDLIDTLEEKTVKLSLDSPIKVLFGQLSLVYNDREYSALAKAKIDKEEYFAKAGASVTQAGNRVLYKPILEYQTPGGKKNIEISGQLVKEVNQGSSKFSLEGVKINLPQQNNVDLSGHCTLSQASFELDLKAQKADGLLFKLLALLKGHDVKVDFQNTINPYINFVLNGHFMNDRETAHNDIELIYGDPANSQNKIIFNQLLKTHKKSPEEFNLITKNKFEIKALPFKLSFDAEVDPKKLDIEFEGQYLDKKAEFDLDARTQIKKPGDYSVKVGGSVDKYGVEVFAKRDIVNADKSNFENYVVIKNFGKYELSGVVLHKNKPNDVNVGAIGHFKISAGGKNEDIKFDVGAIENANLYSSHAKLSGSKGDYVDYLLKITRGPNTSGQLKFILKDTIAANGQFKSTESDGKGNGALIIDFKKAQRKIKGDVKFVVKDPVYNADVDVFLNYEKDNNDKVHFSTNSKFSAKLVDSKNKITYGGKSTELNFHQDGVYKDTGKTHANVEVVLPTERCLNFKFDRDVSEKDGFYSGHAETVISDAAKRGGPASTLTYKGKVRNTNLEKDVVDYEGQIDLKLKDGKGLQNTFYLKNELNGDQYKFDFKSDIKGNLLPKPASLLAYYEYPKDDILEGKQKYRIAGSYGSDTSFEYAGVSELIGYLKKGDQKYLEDFTVTVRLPFEKAHDIKFASYVLFLETENSETFEYTIVESIQVNGDQYKAEGSGKLEQKSGNSKFKIVVPHVDPMSLDVNYKADLEGEKQFINTDVKAQYGKGKTATVTIESSSDHHDCNFQLKSSAPQAESIKKFNVDINYKHASLDTRSAAVVVQINDRVDKFESLVVYSKAHPLVDLKYTDPSNPKPRRLFLKGTTLSSTEGKLEVKIEDGSDFSLDAVTEGNVQKDSIAIKFFADCEKWNLKNYKFDVSSKDGGNGKRLEFRASNDNKNILSGSTSFISKQEGPKTIVEGSGSVTVKDEQKSVNFKYIRTLLTEGHEQGVETFLNWAIGERSYVAESRITNIEYKNSYVYCEEKKQCANIDILSKVNMLRPGVFQHLFNIGFDLRKLNISPEFGLEIKNEVSENKLPQYSLDLHVNKEDKKYHLHAYSQPEFGKFPAGITVTLPHRVLALESLVTYPTNKGLPFPVKVEFAAHPDKNRPQLKTAARANIDLTGNDKSGGAIAEFGFYHPKIVKEAVFRIRANLDRPNENTVKIQTSATFSHPPLGNDLESKIYLEVQPVHVKFVVQAPGVQVIDIEGSSILKDNLQQGDLKFSLLQGKPVLFRGVVKDYRYYEFTTSYTDDSEHKLSVIGHIDPEKRVDVSADIILPGEKKNIIHGALYLQDNLVKSDYGVSKENFNYFVNTLKNDLNNLEGRIQKLGEKTSADFKKSLNKLEPEFKKVVEAYRQDLANIYKDVSFKELSEFLKKLEELLSKTIQEISAALDPVIDKIVHVVQDTAKKIKELFEKQIEPGLKELYTTVGAVVKEYLDGLIDIVAHFAALFTDFFEKHKAELQELTDTIAEIFKDLTRLVVAQLKEIRERVVEILTEVTQQIKELPVVELIKEKWREFVVPEQLLGTLTQVHQTIRELLPTDETKNFADAIYNYVSKKLSQEKVDDMKELRVVYEKFAVALTSLVQFVRNQLNQYGVPSLININPQWPSFLSGTSGSAPGFGFSGVSSSSFFNEFMKGDFPDVLAYIRAYRPRSLNPLEEVPAKLRAVVVNGQHIFTFDGRHLTFPGTCRYVLVHDHVDRNFTLAIQLQNGQPKSLALEDQSGTFIELKENGQVSLNGAAHGFPVMEKDVYAFKQTNGRVGLGSTYGLLALCTSKLEVCYIEVSGFYLGKLRGLLGDGNNEPYDDFRLPNGKITTSESDFGNAYKLAGSCPQVKTPEHTHHQHHATLPPACEKVFGSSSPLKPLSLLLDVAPFRQACIHAVSGDEANAQHQACDLARGYAALAVTGLLPAVLPDVCVQCRDADKPRDIGETYELRLPNKQADIVVAVETTKVNEKNYKELVVPLIGQLIDNLKGKRIADIKVYLVGITSKFPHPIIYDTDIKLNNPKVKFDDESRYNRLPIIKTDNASEQEAIKQIVGLIEEIRIRLGLTNVVAGYRSILDLPLRAGAVKHIINVVGERCYSQCAIVEFLRALAFSVVYEQNAVTNSLVTITPNLAIGGGKTVDQVVGFAEKGVVLLGDKKKNKDAEALRASLDLGYSDACVNFVEKTGGVIYSATNYQALNAGQQKQFLQTAANVITHKMLHQSIVQECTCALVDPFRPRSICVNKDRKETARRRK